MSKNGADDRYGSAQDGRRGVEPCMLNWLQGNSRRPRRLVLSLSGGFFVYPSVQMYWSPHALAKLRMSPPGVRFKRHRGRIRGRRGGQEGSPQDARCAGGAVVARCLAPELADLMMSEAPRSDYVAKRQSRRLRDFIPALLSCGCGGGLRRRSASALRRRRRVAEAEAEFRLRRIALRTLASGARRPPTAASVSQRSRSPRTFGRRGQVGSWRIAERKRFARAPDSPRAASKGGASAARRVFCTRTGEDQATELSWQRTSARVERMSSRSCETAEDALTGSEGTNNTELTQHRSFRMRTISRVWYS
ncbi:hypothetical protein Q5P01_000166 [Channa striata]|uniref:Uncharacterized protein n=1 Tax=Channa striata TaxID=64152 RepID=A0AA88LIF5_CHASR|nr:hypothetical protein Q5P01_000166 [Channa striata]